MDIISFYTFAHGSMLFFRIKGCEIEKKERYNSEYAVLPGYGMGAAE